MIADSKGFLGAKPLALISLVWALDCQLSFVAIMAPVESCNSSVGSAIAPTTPSPVNDGPIARKIILFGTGPRTINPPIRTSLSAPTFRRVEIFARLLERGVGEGGGVGVGVGAGAPYKLCPPAMSSLERVSRSLVIEFMIASTCCPWSSG